MKSWFELMHKKYGYNLRFCSSAITLSSFIEKKCKVVLALSTNAEVNQICEDLLSGGFSCINPRIMFDSKILLPNLNVADHYKLTIDLIRKRA